MSLLCPICAEVHLPNLLLQEGGQQASNNQIYDDMLIQGDRSDMLERIQIAIAKRSLAVCRLKDSGLAHQYFIVFFYNISCTVRLRSIFHWAASALH